MYIFYVFTKKPYSSSLECNVANIPMTNIDPSDINDIKINNCSLPSDWTMVLACS